ncbi:hypothetical protein ACN47E_006293 [Coniothyrium glycines]
MSLFNSVLGSLSPPSRFRRSFEDPHARDHELPLYNSPPSPRVPPPVTSSVLWAAPKTALALAPSARIPDDILAIQRRARHLEKQLQELLDAQADGLSGSLSGQDTLQDDLVSNGSITPTVSSVRSSDRNTEDGSISKKKKKVSLNTARVGIFKRIQQLASIKAEELDLLDEDLRELQITVEKTEAWTQKRTRLEKKIQAIEGEDAGAKTESLQKEASQLEQEIRQKEDELLALKRRHKRVLNDLADTENSKEARLSSYKTSLSLLDKEVSSFLQRPPHTHHVPLSSIPFLTLPPKRRTLDMAHEYWQEEYTRLAEKCEDVDTDRGALDEGAVVWHDVVKKVADYETSLQNYMLQFAGRNSSADPSTLLEQMESTISYLQEKLNLATLRSWNLLVCAIGAELEAFEQGKKVLQEALGTQSKGKGKAKERYLIDADQGEEMTGSAIRITRSPPKHVPAKKHFFDSEDDDPDPELMISHQDMDDD